MVSMMVFLTSWSPVLHLEVDIERAYPAPDDRRDSLHEVETGVW